MRKFHLIYIAVLFFNTLNAQNVGIGTANPQAILDITSTTQGFLPPRMDSTQRNAIISPVNGLTIYNLSINSIQTYNGTGWYSAVHFIGENYGGGKVFYVYDNGQHGLIAATTDQSTGIHWYNGVYTTTNAVRDGVGAGAYNTGRIITNQGAGNYAAQISDYFQSDGFSDWYLPSRHELNLLYLQKNTIGDFSNNGYWSSTEFNNIYVWYQSFYSGNQDVFDKFQDAFNVRLIRAF